MHFVLAYDVVNDGKRTRFFKRLKRYMVPVQKSVFEGDLDPRRLEKVVALVHRELDLAEDRVRIYSLCAACAGLVRSYGVMPAFPDPREPVVL